MAKKMMMGGGMVCRCGPSNFIWMIIAAIVMAIGAAGVILFLAGMATARPEPVILGCIAVAVAGVATIGMLRE
ncbi:MAG: hypothetical protein AABY13_00820 [Nanoarchaeota archaeon]